MMLEAVWLKNGKEVYRICPVVNIVCYEKMKSIADIEIEDGYDWYSYEDADDFVIRLTEESEDGKSVR